MDYALLAQFAWQSLQTAGSVLCTKIWEKLTDNVSEQAVIKFQDMLENKQENEFKQELSNALKYNSRLATELEQLQSKQNNHISIQIGNVTGNNNQVGNVHINQR